MKFTIEVLHIGDGAEEILARSEHDAIAPKWMDEDQSSGGAERLEKARRQRY